MPNHGKIYFSCNKLEKTRETVKDILLFANTSTMEEYLKNYLDAVGDNPDYRFYIFFGEGYSNRRSQTLEGTQLEGKSIRVIPGGMEAVLPKVGSDYLRRSGISISVKERIHSSSSY